MNICVVFSCRGNVNICLHILVQMSIFIFLQFILGGYVVLYLCHQCIKLQTPCILSVMCHICLYITGLVSGRRCYYDFDLDHPDE